MGYYKSLYSSRVVAWYFQQKEERYNILLGVNIKYIAARMVEITILLMSSILNPLYWIGDTHTHTTFPSR